MRSIRNTLFLVLFLCGLLLNRSLEGKVRIFSFHYNKPDFIELQHKTFNKFLLDEFEWIVFNDACEPAMEECIRLTCERLKVQCVRFNQADHLIDPLNEYIYNELKDPTMHSHLGFRANTLEFISRQPSVRHCHVIQYALDNYGYGHDDVIAIVDGDIFPIRPLSIKSLLEESQISGIYKYLAEQNISYFWVPFIALDMPRLPNKEDLKFHVDRIGNFLHDSGAHSYHYLQNNPDVPIQGFSWQSSSAYTNESDKLMKAHGFNQDEIELVRRLPGSQSVEFHLEHHMLHFGASSFGLEGHEIKAACVTHFLNSITSNEFNSREEGY